MRSVFKPKSYNQILVKYLASGLHTALSDHDSEWKCFGNWPRSLGSASLHQSGFLKAGCYHRRCKFKNDPKDSHNSDGF